MLRAARLRIASPAADTRLRPPFTRAEDMAKGGPMSPSVFWRTIIAGVVATFVMTMTGFWQHGIGIRSMDVGAMLAANMTLAHPDTSYSLVAGNLALFGIGLL